MNRALPIASLVISIAALVVAICGRLSPAPAKPDPAQIRAAVDAELQRRETEMVTALAPKFRKIYADMLGDDTKLDERALNPKTFVDLFRPLLTVIEKMQMQGSGEPDPK